MWRLGLVMLAACGELAPELAYTVTLANLDEQATTAFLGNDAFTVESRGVTLSRTFPSYPLAIDAGELHIRVFDAADHLLHTGIVTVGTCTRRGNFDIDIERVVSEHVEYWDPSFIRPDRATKFRCELLGGGAVGGAD